MPGRHSIHVCVIIHPCDWFKQNYISDQKFSVFKSVPVKVPTYHLLLMWLKRQCSGDKNNSHRPSAILVHVSRVFRTTSKS